MPIERPNTATQIRSIVVAVVALVIAVALGYALLQVATGGDSPVVGSNNGRFVVGEAESLSEQIDRDGPINLSDVSGRGQQRPVILNHLGDDPESGWHAFEARPSDIEDCFVAWIPDEEVFGAECAARTYPPDGDGLEQIPVEIDEDGTLILVLRVDEDETTTTAADGS